MRPNNRLGTLSTPDLAALLLPRDIEILTLIRQHRFLTTRHIQRLVFWQHATVSAGTRACVRVLTRLRERKVIYRLERQVGGVRAGSAAYVWGIDDAGDRLLRSLDLSPSPKRSRPLEPSPLFLQHTLTISEVRTRLEETAREDHFELLSIQTEPTNWRTFDSPHGPEILKPDLHVITANASFEDHWFIEVDLGTESLPTLIHKCQTYQAHWATGTEQTQVGVYPRVVWLIENTRRQQRLLSAIAKDARLDSDLFIACDTTHFINLCSATAA
jgi:hypothetical protein